jgi:RNA polymerase sigma factor (sigma-70 family)
VLRKVVQSAAALDQSAATDRELLRRFARDNDQAAFEALVTRHTGMVLGVCRRALSNVQDAEDACQATFLVLANQAKGGQWQESLANWLYTTARKVAHNARRAAERRAKREAGAAVPEAVEPVDRMTGRELLAALDAALDGLPARYRAPLVLCYLEGLTRDEAAARLGVPLATLHTRIDRARKRLHELLTKAGCAVGAGLLALAACSPAGASPPRLVKSVLASASGSPPAAVSELAKGVAVNGSFSKVVLALVAVAVVALGAGLGWLQMSAADQPAAKPAPAVAADEKAKDQPKDAGAKPAVKETTATGRVLDPDGKPLAGAKLYMGRIEGPLELGASGADGKFKVKVPVPAGHFSVWLIARAEGAGMDFPFIPVDRLGEEVELRLVKDNPVRGTIVDTQGKPVAGATVAVSKLCAFADNSLDEFLDGYKRGDRSPLYPGAAETFWCDTGALPAVTTDKDGKFEITGVGAERLAALRVRGPGLAVSELWVVNRKGFDPKPYNESKPEPARPGDPRPPLRPAGSFPLHAPDLSVVSEPEKRIRGTVTDVDTGKPRAGAKVALVRDEQESSLIHLAAVTDAEGKYEIRGAPKALTYLLSVPVDPDTRHVATRLRVDDTAGYEPLTADIKVKKGVVITGKVIDTETKKPVRGYAKVTVLADNKFAKDYPGFVPTEGVMFSTGEDGTFRIVTIPGPVLLVGGASGDRDKYKRAADPTLPGSAPGNFSKVLEIRAGAETVTQDILLEPEK